MFDALDCRSWIETLDAYTFLVQKYYLNPVKVQDRIYICLAMLSR
jgi:hypothetical protein